MKKLGVALLLFSAVARAIGQDNPPTEPPGEVVFREPFTLRLDVGKKHAFEQLFERVPYVQNGQIFLFNGDKFGVALGIQEGSVRSVSYCPDTRKSDVSFEFRQGFAADRMGMTLIIENHSQQTLFFDALMAVPGRKGMFKRTVLPVHAELHNYEFWPHPIVQLLLRNVRLQKGRVH